MDPSSLNAKRQLLVQHPILEEAVYGESGSVDVEAMNIALPDVKKIIAEYALCDVYNMDETGKFYLLYF